MRPHISLDVRDVAKSAAFYEKVFGVKPQKQVADYAKFDLKVPALNFSVVSSTGEVSSVDHLGIEVETVDEIAEWKTRLQDRGILQKVEENIACCFARQDKLWFSDPDGNAFETRWWIYPEASSLRDARGQRFPPEVTLSRDRGPTTSLVAPEVQRPETVHVILEVQDAGTPPLWTYRRTVLAVQP